MSTPFAVNRAHLARQRFTLVLLDSEADVMMKMRTALSNYFGPRLGSFTPAPKDDGAFSVAINNVATIAFAQTAGTMVGESAPIAHPILTGSFDPTKVRSIVSIAQVEPALPGTDNESREGVFAQLRILAEATAALCTLPGVVGVRNDLGRVIAQPDIYAEAVARDEAPHYLATAWITPGEGRTINAGTVGMPPLGHPEIQIQGFTGDPTDLYYRMANLIDYAARGPLLKPGDTLSFGEGQPPISITEATNFVSSDIPTVEVHLT